MTHIAKLASFARAATFGLLMSMISGTGAFAGCYVYEGNVCSGTWTKNYEFWHGSYIAISDPAAMFFDGKGMFTFEPNSPSAGAMIGEAVGGGLLISIDGYPLNFVTKFAAEPIGSGPELHKFIMRMILETEEYNRESRALLLQGVYLACKDQRLPTWQGPAYTTDANPLEMTLDLVALNPLVILGRLHANTVYQAHKAIPVVTEQMLFFYRDKADYKEIDGMVELDDQGACHAVCKSEPWRCPMLM